MNLKTFIGTFLSIATLSYVSIAQTSTALMPSMENIVPPSPNVAAINKFGNIPVGLSTGIPSVGVPVYEWSGQNFGINFKVSLDYHAGGIKVDEVASSVGLGWALNAGGVISRTKRGIPDEFPTDGFLNRSLPNNDQEGNTPIDYANSDRLLYRMNAGYIDTQNDIFNYNFNGRSGRFVLGKNGDILFLDNAKLKVIWDTQSIEGRTLFTKFTITDELGYKYVFSAYETTRQDPASFSGFYTSAWHLTEIINPSGKDSIVLQYEDTYMNMATSMSSTEAIPAVLDAYTLAYSTNGGSQPFVNTKRIKSIIFPDQNSINFSYDSIKRQDFNSTSNEYLLKKIIISKGITNRGFLFAQNYSLGGRATLLSVTQIGGTQEKPLKPYTFQYYNAVLPQRLSTSQDHWGYANSNTGPLIPKEYFAAPGGNYGPYREFTGGNRDTDPERIKAGSMTKITYPTGGYTVFELEANRAKDDWLEQDLSYTSPGPSTKTESINAPVSSDKYPAGNESFIYQGENSASTYFKLQFEPGNCSLNCALKFELYNSSGQLMNTQQADFSSSSSMTVVKTFGIVGLVKGATYSFRIYTINLTNFYNYVNIEWTIPIPSVPVVGSLKHTQLYVGGLRAKKVSDYLPGSATPAIVREYEYTMEDGTSSGALGFRPVYSQMAYYTYKYDETTPSPPTYIKNGSNNYILRYSSSVYDLAYANGSPVTYKRVVERIGQSGNDIGKVVRYFTSFSDSPPVIHDVFPTIPTSLHRYSYGLLLREETFNASGSIQKKTENTYNFIASTYAGNQQRVENFRSISLAPVSFLCPKAHLGGFHVHPGNTPYYFLMSSFTPVEGRAELTQTKVTEIDNLGRQSEEVTSFTYDPETYLPKQTILLNSKQEQKKTVLSYPKDFPSNPVYQAMNSKNIIKPVVLEQVFTNTTLDFSRQTEYKNWSSEVYEPFVISTQFKSGSLDPRIRYLKYDVHGAPLSVQQELGTKICYIWGYGGDYLVAKVTNIDYSTLENLLGGAIAIEAFRNNKTISESAVNTFLAPLRNYVNNTKAVLMVDFKYDTLKGIVSQSDEKGLVTTYEYDDFQRLMNIKDFGGKIIKNFKYNQQGQ
jgi:hypothetical protein